MSAKDILQLLVLFFLSEHLAFASFNYTAAKLYLTDYNVQARQVYHDKYWYMFIWMKNQTAYNQNVSDEKAAALIKFDIAQAEKAKKLFSLTEFNETTIASNVTLRELKKIQTVGLVLSDTESALLQNKISSMQTVYNAAFLCADRTAPHEWCPKDKRMWLDPEITEDMAKSGDYDHLLWLWKGWRDQTGPKIGTLFRDYVTLSNLGARNAGFPDAGAYWRSAYEDSSLFSDIETIWYQLLPVYEELHAYVRTQLRSLYPGKFDNSPTIPAHLFGNMWAQDWSNLLDRIAPYKDIGSVDVTSAMQMSNLTNSPLRMWQTAEDFYTSLGLPAMTDRFWKDSQITRPLDPDIQVECHGDSETFYNGKDYGIVMCTKVNMEDFITIHHEMGHTQYFMAYSDKPVKFQDGANPGFHEAIGDTMALSVGTPKHLKKVGLLKENPGNRTEQQDINYLFYQALQKIAFLPFGLLIDTYRWKVFDGTIPFSKLNSGWWELRYQYQGISPPVDQSERDFDAGSKFHVAANVPYIRYFVSFIIQFQFYQALCEMAAEDISAGKLHLCDFYQSKVAGERLSEMLRLAASKPWPDAMQTMTRNTSQETNKMNAQALLVYFQPLLDFLSEQNANTANLCYGWGYQWPDSVLNSLKTPRCAQEGYSIENSAMLFLDNYNASGEMEMYKDTMASWNYQTNLTDYNGNQSILADKAFNEWQLKQSSSAAGFDTSQINSFSVKRQLEMIRTIGINLTSEETGQLSAYINEMNKIYSTARICPYTNRKCNLTTDDSWDLSHNLTERLTKSRDYDELAYIWDEWRLATKSIKQIYPKFVNLSNQGATNGGFNDTGQWWRYWYRTADDKFNFQTTIEDLFAAILPLYEELHAYVRRRLREHYRFNSSAIPAHILGNMWAQDWENIFALSQPFTNTSLLDVTDTMLRQNYTPERMFHTADQFFQSLGLIPMPETFWNGTIWTKPSNVEGFVCHASAWDFCNRKDYRIKMCTRVNMEDLVTIHHEMGHVQYYLQYSVQPITFREGANPGFHEAIGDTMALSVATPTHLNKIGLLNDSNSSPNSEQEINFLFRQALSKVAFLPFGYLIDQWRWKVFDGTVAPDAYNKVWWQLRNKYQGITPAAPRPSDAFDPACKSHITDNTPYIRYFVSYIAQFQFYKALCAAADHKGPLHNCDFYQNKNAGKKLASMLKLGSSQYWPDAMQVLTGDRKLDASAILEYFKPLQEWLHVQNLNSQECYGWGHQWPDSITASLSGPRCSSQISTTAPPTSTTAKPSGTANAFRENKAVIFILLACVLFVWEKKCQSIF